MNKIIKLFILSFFCCINAGHRELTESFVELGNKEEDVPVKVLDFFPIAKKVKDKGDEPNPYHFLQIQKPKDLKEKPETTQEKKIKGEFCRLLKIRYDATKEDLKIKYNKFLEAYPKFVTNIEFEYKNAKRVLKGAYKNLDGRYCTPQQ